MLAALGLAAGAQARSGGHCEGHGGRGGHGLEKIERKVERLELAPETRQAIYDVIDQARDQERETRSQIRSSHERMRELLSQSSPSEEEVLALADSIGTLETDASKRRLRTMLQIRALVTPEQWQELHAGFEKRHGKHRGARPEDAEEAL
jgi:Spy/CpxP family protein refolding chaperone